MGVIASCQAVGIPTSEFRADLKVNRDFRDRFLDARLALREKAEETIYKAATEPIAMGNPAVAMAYVKLDDDRKARRRMAKTIAPALREREPNLRLLDDEQWTRYVGLYERLAAGELLDAGDAMIYTQLLAVTMSPGQIAIEQGDDDE